MQRPSQIHLFGVKTSEKPMQNPPQRSPQGYFSYYEMEKKHEKTRQNTEKKQLYYEINRNKKPKTNPCLDSWKVNSMIVPSSVEALDFVAHGVSCGRFVTTILSAEGKSYVWGRGSREWMCFFFFFSGLKTRYFWMFVCFLFWVGVLFGLLVFWRSVALSLPLFSGWCILLFGSTTRALPWFFFGWCFGVCLCLVFWPDWKAS